MNPLVYLAMGLSMLWLQVTLAGSMAIWGVAPNLLLLTVLLCGLRWQDRWQFAYAALAGLACDVFSHGMLGVYGLSFFLVSYAARLAGIAMYESNPLSLMVLVGGLSVMEGVLSTTIFNLLDGGAPWWHWLFTAVLPVALYHAVLTPLFLLAFERIERRWGLEVTSRGYSA